MSHALQPWERHGYQSGLQLADGRWIGVYETVTGNGRLVVCNARNDITQAFCYTSVPEAVQAMQRWDGQSEPDGWFRDVLRARRRPQGDPRLEYTG